MGEESGRSPKRVFAARWRPLRLCDDMVLRREACQQRHRISLFHNFLYDQWPAVHTARQHATIDLTIQCGGEGEGQEIIKQNAVLTKSLDRAYCIRQKQPRGVRGGSVNNHIPCVSEKERVEREGINLLGATAALTRTVGVRRYVNDSVVFRS